MITQEQTKQCSDALIEWFKSQDCDPADGSMVMLHLIASQLVAKTKDLKELTKACQHAHLLLTLNVALKLKEGV